jgi:opacity protein-like surface antigen
MHRASLNILAAATLAAAALLGTGSAAANQPYIGVSVGQADYRLDTTGTTAADTKDTGYKVYGGTMFTPNFGLEAAYFDLGQATGAASLPGFGSIGITGKARGGALVGIAAAPFGDAAVFAKAGFAQVRGEVDARTPLGNVSESDSSLQPAFGLGASYAFTSNVSARIEWERVRVRYADDLKEDTDLVSAGVVYRF